MRSLTPEEQEFADERLQATVEQLEAHECSFGENCAERVIAARLRELLAGAQQVEYHGHIVEETDYTPSGLSDKEIMSMWKQRFGGGNGNGKAG